MDIWEKVRKICKRIDSDYDPENNLGQPLVTNIDMELKDAALLLADYCESLDERIRELETNAAIRRQAEEDARAMIAQPQSWHCANCGNPLEDKGTPSKIYRGPVCDVCADMEK